MKVMDVLVISMETVSVLIPCYNDGEYIDETFESIAAQTWENIEVIVVDDGSQEKTLKVLEKLRDNGYCKLYYQKHQGPAAARNFAFSKSNGAYILPLDADDCIEPTYIEKAVKILKENKKIGACYCEADLFDGMSGKWDLPQYSVERMLVDNVVFVSSVMKREVYQQIGGYDVSFRTGMEDYDFYLSMLENGWEIYQIPEVLFHYRIKNMSRSQKLMLSAQEYHQIYRKLFIKHKMLYIKHADELIPDLREQMLVQRQRIIDLEKQVALLEHTFFRRVRRKIKKILKL